MKMIDAVVKELYYGLSEGVAHDREYKDRDLEFLIELDTLVKGYEKFLSKDNKTKTLFNPLINAINNRQLRAIEVACNEAFLYGISFCNQVRGMNVQDLIVEKEMLIE